MLRAKLDIFLNSEVLKKVLLALLILVCTSSCLLRSHYKRPCINSPAHWRENANEDLVIANCKWWDNLNDANLSSLIHIALENNSDLSIAVGRVNQYVAELNIAKSYQLPEISGSAAASRQKIPLNINLPPIFPTGFNIFNLFSGLLNATFYLDIWGKIQNRVDAAEAELKASIEAKRSVVLTVVSQLSVNYIQLLKYEKQQKISLDTYHSRQNSYELFKLRFEGGLISEMEVKQAEAEALEALIEVKRLIALAAQTENQISVLIGSNPVHIERGNLLEMLLLTICKDVLRVCIGTFILHFP